MNVGWAFCHRVIGEMPQVRISWAPFPHVKQLITSGSERHHGRVVTCEIPGQLGRNAWWGRKAGANRSVTKRNIAEIESSIASVLSKIR